MPSKFIDLNLIQRYDAIVNEKIETAMQNSGGEKIPIGTIFEFPTDDITKLPTGYLFCDGSAVSRTTYADLFAVIGTTWGSGDGSTTFNLPSKEGLVTVGVDSNDTDFDTIGETGGEKTHTLTVSEMPAHNHSINYVYPFTAGGLGTYLPATNQSSPTGTSGGDIKNMGGSQAHNNLQPYVVSNYIIKAANVSQLPDEAEVVDGYSTSTTDAYSANYVNNTLSTLESNVVMQPTVLWSGTPTQSGVTLSDNITNYSYVEVFFHTNDGSGFKGSQKAMAGAGVTAMSLQFSHVLSGNYYIKVREIQISGTQITTLWTKEIYNGGMSDSNCIYITKVLGYK